MNTNNLVEFRPPRAGAGRKLGAKNKLQSEVKEMILTALSELGGVEYLKQQAKDNPVAFLALLGKIVPREVAANVSLDAAGALAERLQAARERLSQAKVVNQPERGTPEMWRAFLASHNTKVIPMESNDQ